jgi:hypothetical protein
LGFVYSERSSAKFLLVLVRDSRFKLVGIDVDEAEATTLDDAGV